MAAPTTLVITYTGGANSPQTISIRAGTDQNNAVHNIFLYGGFWYASPAGVQIFVPWGQITSITAQ
jgi:hypothetical protein